MPKGQKKTKQFDRIRNETNNINDDSGSEDNFPFPVAEPVENESNEQEFIIDKFKDAINGATQKSAKGRKACLESIQNILSSKYFPDLIDVISANRETITESIKSSLKRGNADEKSLAATLSALTCIQLGPGSSSESIFADLGPLLTTTLNDNSIEFETRSKCASTLALLAFIVGEIDHATISSLMSTFESIFSAAYFDNGAVPKHTLEATALHTSALAAWNLLSTLENNNNVSLMRLSELLKSSDVELRIVAGESIALLFELAREGGNVIDGASLDDLCAELRELATDGRKNRGKKERKQQRSSFREILRTVEGDDMSVIKVRFGVEVSVLDSWARRFQYDALCSVLGCGMNLHLAQNQLLRDIFELGPPLIADEIGAMKTSKKDRHLGNVAAFKKRSLDRLHFQDKRSVVFDDEFYD